MTNLLVSKATIFGLIPVGRVNRDSTGLDPSYSWWRATVHPVKTTRDIGCTTDARPGLADAIKGHKSAARSPGSGLPSDSAGRASPRRTSRVVVRPHGERSAGPIPSKGSWRECDTRIAYQSGPRRGEPRSRQAPDMCALLRESSAPTNTQARPDKAGNAGDDARCLKERPSSPGERRPAESELGLSIGDRQDIATAAAP